ncbi:SDR family NAD(P)-dependent oxidoreductase [Caulobacter endophyticus]|uniref:Oxidoreductase n=1 Tax=Caulobacter endophyticus TaxID=2172652 RepID=A0A2T9K9W5_9CAUL|nr:SDR family NAD(P)-dependent oxidoreductase [Caulobacter endophyticus]PVM92716.1 oxidoreductase [Caulobacter endophyticus]
MKRDKSFSLGLKAGAPVSFAGKTAIIVGGTGGLGREIARSIAQRGGQVVVVGRTFRDTEMLGIRFVQADLSLMREAARVADVLPAEHADFLIFTTGIFAAPHRQQTQEGLERDIAVSFLNRVVMLRRLAPRLGRARTDATSRPRVFVMGYPGSGQAGAYDDLNAERSYKGMAVHMNTVAGNEILVADAVDRYPELDTFGLNPGLIKTDIRSNMLGAGSLQHRIIEALIGAFSPTPRAYAEKMAPLIASPRLEGQSGRLFNRDGDALSPSPGIDKIHSQRFLNASEALVRRTGITLAG